METDCPHCESMSFKTLCSWIDFVLRDDSRALPLAPFVIPKGSHERAWWGRELDESEVDLVLAKALRAPRSSLEAAFPIYYMHDEHRPFDGARDLITFAVSDDGDDAMSLAASETGNCPIL